MTEIRSVQMTNAWQQSGLRVQAMNERKQQQNRQPHNTYEDDKRRQSDDEENFQIDEYA